MKVIRLLFVVLMVLALARPCCATAPKYTVSGNIYTVQAGVDAATNGAALLAACSTGGTLSQPKAILLSPGVYTLPPTTADQAYANYSIVFGSSVVPGDIVNLGGIGSVYEFFTGTYSGGNIGVDVTSDQSAGAAAQALATAIANNDLNTYYPVGSTLPVGDGAISTAPTVTLHSGGAGNRISILAQPISQTLTVPDYTSLCGIGRSATIQGVCENRSSGQGGSIVALGNHCGLYDLRVTNNSTYGAPGVEFTGSYSEVIGCEVTCTEWCIYSTTSCHDIVVSDCILSGINPFWPGQSKTYYNWTFVRNTGFSSTGSDNCEALWDGSGLDANSNRFVVADNYFYFQRNAPSVAPYFINVGGWGHSIRNNHIQITVDAANTSVAGPNIVNVYNNGTVPTVVTTEQETLIEGNTIDIFYKNVASSWFSSAPLVITTGANRFDHPMTLRNNHCNIKGIKASDGTPATINMPMVTGLSAIPANQALITVGRDGLFEANAAASAALAANAQVIGNPYGTGSGAPTLALLDTAFAAGSSAYRALLAGWFRGIYVNSTGGAQYECWTDGTTWYYEALTAAS